MTDNGSLISVTLTPKERKMAISGKKTKQKKITLKSVLLNPLSTSFELIEETSDKVTNILLMDLKKLVESEVDKKKMVVTRAALTIGVNATYRHLETNAVGAVLLASDIQPESLVAHVVRRCDSLAVSVAKVRSLRTMTQNVLGFSSICLGLLNKNDTFKNAIEVMSKNQIKVIDETYDSSLLSTEKEVASTLVRRANEIPSRDFMYLKRSSNATRTFIPKKAALATCAEDTDLGNKANFIPFSSTDFTEDNVSKGIANADLTQGNKITEAMPKGISCSKSKKTGTKKRKGESPENKIINAKKLKVKNSEDSKRTPVFMPAKVNIIKGNPSRKERTNSKNKSTFGRKQ